VLLNVWARLAKLFTVVNVAITMVDFKGVRERFAGLELEVCVEFKR
jgi:hypothetical protein